MAQFQDLVARTRATLFGYLSKQQQWTYLTQNIGPTDLTFTVNDASQISRGLVEIGKGELALVQSVNRSTNTITIVQNGRGFAGTTAGSYTTNTDIENNPIFPTIRIKDAINDTIRSLYPELFAIATTKFPKISVVYNYGMPADAEDVLQVKYQIIGPSKIYPWDHKWKFDNNADPTDFPTGKSLYVLEEITPGREIFVVYSKEPSVLVNDTDDYATTTGLLASSQDVVYYGSLMKMVPALANPRLILDTVESSERASFVQPNQVTAIYQAWSQLYQDRLEREKRKLNTLYPRDINFSA
jgi:hypothetical protein